MKKIIAVIVLLLLAFGGYKGYKYYEETYKSETAYAKTPETVPPLKDTLDNQGKKVDNLKSYDYQLTFVTESGQKIDLSYSVSSENPQPLEPNSYITAEVSKKRITKGPSAIEEAKIPKDVLNKLANN